MNQFLPLLSASLLALTLPGCNSNSNSETIAVQSKRNGSFYNFPNGGSFVKARSTGSRSVSTLMAEVALKQDIMSRSCRGRTGAAMSPKYITIHSTQNWSPGADSLRHSLALKNSKLGRISWHFTTDENRAVQHLPTTERGNHADHDGPGNRYSIGIEMCEYPGNSLNETMERTAKLTAYLMVKHDIPLSRVVPHYHWPRWGKNPPNKNCPHFLMTNGKPGAKWQAYLAKVNRYYSEVSGRGSSFARR